MSRLALVLQLFLPQSAQYADVIEENARKHELDPLLVAAVIYKESRFNPRACYRGAYGLMQVQLRPTSCTATAAQAARQRLFEPEHNIARGAALMGWWRRWWRRKHRDSGFHWLLFYNQGFGKCSAGRRRCSLGSRLPVRAGRVGGYADRVLQIYRKLKDIEVRLPRPAV